MNVEINQSFFLSEFEGWDSSLSIFPGFFSSPSFFYYRFRFAAYSLAFLAFFSSR